MQNNDNKMILSIHSKTWGRDSHGLFDYECTQTKNKNIFIVGKSFITRKGYDIQQMSDKKDISEENKFLFEIANPSNRYFFNSPVELMQAPSEQNIAEMQDKMWYIIKYEDSTQANTNPQLALYSNMNEYHKLRLNDVIKLGRVKYVLTEISFRKDNTKQIFDLVKQDIALPENYEETTCKICLFDSNDEENPLITLCKCKGSMECVHYLCLKKWMEVKLSVKINEKKKTTSYNMKTFNCEICKSPYPLCFRFNNKIFDLIELKRPENSKYIILESLNQLKDNNNYKSIHVIELTDKEKILMGRGHDSDVRINDISVSRIHASLNFENDEIILKDLKSKFGTLVLLKDSVEIFADQKINLQVGRTFVQATLYTYKDYLKMKSRQSVKDDEQNKNSKKSYSSKADKSPGVLKKESNMNVDNP